MANWSSALQGGLAGAGTGAALGSFFPGIGNAIGAGVGGVTGLLGGLLSPQLGGSQASVKNISTLSQPQQQLQNQSINQILSLLQGNQSPLLGSGSFAPIAAQAKSNFAQQTVPSLSERFTSLGNNALSSPAFASQLGQAGAGLNENLAAMEQQFKQNQNQQSLQLLQALLSGSLVPSSNQIYQPEQAGVFEAIFPSLLSSLPQLMQNRTSQNSVLSALEDLRR